MYIEKNEFQVVTLEKEIKVFGISNKKSGIAFFNLWSKIDEIIRDAKHKKSPETNYGIGIAPYGQPHGPNGEYIVGTEVTDFEGQSDAYSTFTIPAGRYFQNTFNAENFDKLVTERIGNTGMKEWAAENGIDVNWDDIAIEIYPDGVKTAQYPEMSLMRRIKE